MSTTTTVRTPGVGIASLLLVAFIVLKLTGVIAWSWWWVLAPAWIPLAIAALAFLVVFVILTIANNAKTASQRRRAARRGTAGLR